MTTIALAHNPTNTFVGEKVIQKQHRVVHIPSHQLRVVHIPSHQRRANVMIKAFSPAKFVEFWRSTEA